jgi:hypothetical protein
MGVREQLTRWAERIRAGWELLPLDEDDPRVEQIALVVTRPAIPLEVRGRLQGRMNAAEICGVPAGHLLISGLRNAADLSTAEVVAYLVYSEVSWNQPMYLWKRPMMPWLGRLIRPAADFEELLAALEPGTPDAAPGVIAEFAARPLPVVGGLRARWLCEYCYAMAFSERRPASWGRVIHADGAGLTLPVDVCGDCLARMDAAGDPEVPLGAYAEGPDPRR